MVSACRRDNDCQEGLCDRGQCSPKDPAEGERCDYYYRCQQGHDCVQGRCRKQCPTASPTCKYNAVKEKHYEIKESCETDKDCPFHRFCDTGTKTCLQTGTHQCTKDTNLSETVCSSYAKKLCLLEECYYTCEKDNDCVPFGGGECTKIADRKVCVLEERDFSFPKMAIVGIVLGGVFLIVTTILTIWFIKRRRRKARAKKLAPFYRLKEDFKFEDNYDKHIFKDKSSFAAPTPEYAFNPVGNIDVPEKAAVYSYADDKKGV